MITKFYKYINESIVDKMFSKSDEDLRKAYKKYDIDIDNVEIIYEFDDLIEGETYEMFIPKTKTKKTIKIVSNDFTELNRPIKYLSSDLSLTKEDFINQMKQNKYTTSIFSMWDHDFNNYIIYKEKINESLVDKMTPVTKEEAIGDIDSFIENIIQRFNDEIEEEKHNIEPDYVIIPDLLDAIILLYDIDTYYNLTKLLIDNDILDVLDIRNKTKQWYNKPMEELTDDEYYSVIEDILQDAREKYIFELLDLIKKRNRI